MVDFIAGCGPLSDAAGEWLGAHPLAALALVALCVAAGAALEGGAL